MDSAGGRLLIERFTAWAQAPALTTDEVNDLVAISRHESPWAAGSTYAVGDFVRVIIAPNSEARFRAMLAGTSDVTEPTWTEADIDDGSVRWMPAGDPQFDVYGAAAIGWEWKAARVAGRYDFGRGDQSWDRSQMFAHCTRQAAYYRARGTGVADSAAAANVPRSGLGTITVRPGGGAYLLDEYGDLVRVDPG